MGRVRKGVEGVGRVFCGHTPMIGGIRSIGNVFCIDTGAVYGLTQGFAEASLAIMELTGNQAHRQAVINPTHSMPEKVW